MVGKYELSKKRVFTILAFFAGSVFMFALSSYFDFFEDLFFYSQSHEQYNIDELIVVALFWLVLLFFLIIKRNDVIFRQNIKIRKLNEKILQQMERRNKLYSILAHDLKTPFNSMIGFLDYLEEDYDRIEDSKRKEIISLLNQVSHSSFDLLNNLLLWSLLDRNEALINKESVNLSNLIETEVYLLKAFAKRKEITVTQSVPSDLMVFADPSMLRVVFRNLLSNAVKYSYEGGRITIEAIPSEEDVKITIEDDGKGLSHEQLKMLNQGEHLSTVGTNEEKGTGFGVRTSKEIIARHNGEMQIFSHEGEGCQVRISLPIIQ